MEASLPSWRTEEGLYCLGSRRPGQGVGFTQLLWEATLLGTDLELDTNLLSALFLTSTGGKGTTKWKGNSPPKALQTDGC